MNRSSAIVTQVRLKIKAELKKRDDMAVSEDEIFTTLNWSLEAKL